MRETPYGGRTGGKFEMKYMFDFASGVCVWSVNMAARERYGYPVKAEALPISNELVYTLQEIGRAHV